MTKTDVNSMQQKMGKAEQKIVQLEQKLRDMGGKGQGFVEKSIASVTQRFMKFGQKTEAATREVRQQLGSARGDEVLRRLDALEKAVEDLMRRAA